MQNHNILPGAGSGKDTKLTKFCPVASMDTESIKLSCWHTRRTIKFIPVASTGMDSEIIKSILVAGMDQKLDKI